MHLKYIAYILFQVFEVSKRIPGPVYHLTVG